MTQLHPGHALLRVLIPKQSDRMDFVREVCGEEYTRNPFKTKFANYLVLCSIASSNRRPTLTEIAQVRAFIDSI